MEPIAFVFAIAFVVSTGFAIYAFVRNASLKEAVKRLENQTEVAQDGHDNVVQLDASVKSMREWMQQEIQGNRSREEERDQKVRAALAAVEDNTGKVVERVDGLVGRWQNPKRRSQLGEGWLVAALKRMGLTHGVHFSTQRRVEIVGSGGTKEGVIDVCLTLPDGQEMAIDDKFPWPRHMTEVLGGDGTEETKTFALRKLRDALRSHVKDVGTRNYKNARDARIRHVLVVVPDWQTLELVKVVDPTISDFAVDQGVGLLPQDALYELASALAEVHREQGWSEKVREIFTPQHADRMYKACIDFLDRVGTAFKRYKSLGEALEGLRAPLAPNGRMARDVLEPAARAAEKASLEFDADIKEIEAEKVARHSERLKTRRSDLGKLDDHDREAA